MPGGADSLCQPQARERSSERPETGTRREGRTFHARSRCVPPHVFCRSRSRLRPPGTFAPAGGAAGSPSGPSGRAGTGRGTAFSGNGANPRLSSPRRERQEKPSRARWERGWGWQPLRSPAQGSRQPARRQPAPFACRDRPAAPYNLIFPRARRSIAAHLIHSAVPRDGEGGEGRAEGGGGTSVGIPMGCACSPACRAGTPARAAGGGGFADTVTSAISV